MGPKGISCKKFLHMLLHNCFVLRECYCGILHIKLLPQNLMFKPPLSTHCEIPICAFTRAFRINSINQTNARPIIACYVRIFSFWHSAPTFDPSYLARETVSGNAWLSKNVDTVERFRTMAWVTRPNRPRGSISTA